MDNNKYYFYISGFLAFTLFSLFFFSFVILLFQPNKKNSFALQKDNYVSVSIKIPEKKVHKQRKVQKSAVVQKPVVQQKKNVDINNLFSDVWTKKIVHKKKEPKVKPEDNRRLLDIQKKIKTTKKNSVESLSKKIETLQSVDSKQTNESSSTAEEVNEYLAKIQAIVYQYFHVPANSAGSSVKTVIELNAFGKVLDFRVLNYSTNSALNEEVDKMKERLMGVTFPMNPQHTSSRTTVILISKE